MDTRAPSRGSVPCGRPSAGARETVSVAPPLPALHNDLFLYFFVWAHGRFLFGQVHLDVKATTLGRLTNTSARYLLTLIHK